MAKATEDLERILQLSRVKNGLTRLTEKPLAKAHATRLFATDGRKQWGMRADTIFDLLLERGYIQEAPKEDSAVTHYTTTKKARVYLAQNETTVLAREVLSHLKTGSSVSETELTLSLIHQNNSEEHIRTAIDALIAQSAIHTDQTSTPRPLKITEIGRSIATKFASNEPSTSVAVQSASSAVGRLIANSVTPKEKQMIAAIVGLSKADKPATEHNVLTYCAGDPTSPYIHQMTDGLIKTVLDGLITKGLAKRTTLRGGGTQDDRLVILTEDGQAMLDVLLGDQVFPGIDNNDARRFMRFNHLHHGSFIERTVPSCWFGNKETDGMTNYGFSLTMARGLLRFYEERHPDTQISDDEDIAAKRTGMSHLGRHPQETLASAVQRINRPDNNQWGR